MHTNKQTDIHIYHSVQHIVSNPPAACDASGLWRSAQLYGQLVWPNVNRLDNLISEEGAAFSLPFAFNSWFGKAIKYPSMENAFVKRIRDIWYGRGGECRQVGWHQHSQKVSYQASTFLITISLAVAQQAAHLSPLSLTLPAPSSSMWLWLWQPDNNNNRNSSNCSTTRTQQAGQH